MVGHVERLRASGTSRKPRVLPYRHRQRPRSDVHAAPNRVSTATSVWRHWRMCEAIASLSGHHRAPMPNATGREACARGEPTGHGIACQWELPTQAGDDSKDKRWQGQLQLLELRTGGEALLVRQEKENMIRTCEATSHCQATGKPPSTPLIDREIGARLGLGWCCTSRIEGGVCWIFRRSKAGRWHSGRRSRGFAIIRRCRCR